MTSIQNADYADWPDYADRRACPNSKASRDGVAKGYATGGWNMMEAREDSRWRHSFWIGVVVMAVAAVPLQGDGTTQSADERVTAAEQAALPDAVDLRPAFKKLGLKPRWQGHRPSCSVFTTAGALEFAASKHLGKPTVLSVEYLNWAANQVIGNKTKDRGQFFRHLLKGFERYGICPESDMPYQPRFDPQNQPSKEARKSASEFSLWGSRCITSSRTLPARPTGRSAKRWACGW